jgi:hypothetical protein
MQFALFNIMGAPNCTLLNRYILIIGIGGKY